MISEFLFRITEPMLFRSSGEFSPQARGPFSFARSLLLPTPSTIAGCLATLMGRFSDVSGKDWEEEVVNALALPEGAFLRGPYLIAGDKTYIPIEHGKTYGFLELSAIREFVKALLGSEEEKKEIWKSLTDRGSYVPMRDYTIEHLGIKLKSEEKTIEEGGIYLARFRDYLAAFEGKDVWVGMEAHNFQPNVGGVAKLGGEGRITRIERRDSREIYRLVEEFKKVPASGCALVLVSHSLIEPPPNKPEMIESGIYVYPPLHRSIEKLLPSGVNVRSIVGSACLLGTGFSIHENRKCRKPVYVALSPGTVIEIEYKPEHADSIVDTYNRGLSVIGGRIGYGTFIPVGLS
jgi:CRISPR-associated protein Cmr3